MEKGDLPQKKSLTFSRLLLDLNSILFML